MPEIKTIEPLLWEAGAHWLKISFKDNGDMNAAEALFRAALAATPQSGGVWPEHASPLPWSYHRKLSETTPGHRDWIEDANGNVVVEHVGHIDGPAICTAVNARSTLAGPIPEAPADEGVEGRWTSLKDELEAIQYAAHNFIRDNGMKTIHDLVDLALVNLASLRRSTETVRPGVREAAVDAVVSYLRKVRNTAVDVAVPGSGESRRRIEIIDVLLEDLPAAIRALSAPLAEEQPTHRHKKRGTEYVLIGIGRMQAELWVEPGASAGWSPIDMREVAVYRSATDPTEIWVRPREEFEDGRFEPLPRSTTGGAK